MNIINAYPIIRFASEAAAAELAAANAADDPDFTYTVTASGDRFVVAVYDEDGIFIGCL